MTGTSAKSLESEPWFYFTVDLSFDGHATVTFVRFVDVNGDRTGALVEIADNKYFGIPRLVLLPYQRGAGPEYFSITERDQFCSVWTFDGTDVGDVPRIDLKSEWPRNILDKAAITPYKKVVALFGNL